MPVKEELDRAVPPHDLLDVSANKSKAELANRGGLANRQLPTSGKKSGGLSNSSSVCCIDFIVLLGVGDIGSLKGRINN